jgi:hypothetical protein
MDKVSIAEYNSTRIGNEAETVINRLSADNKAAHDLNDYLTKENQRLRGAAKDRPKDRPKDAADEIERLREALADLVAVQNGPPLVTYTEAWDAAMEKAYAALKEGE